MRAAKPLGNQKLERLTHDFGRRVPKDSRGAFVEKDDALAVVYADDRVCRYRYDRGENRVRYRVSSFWISRFGHAGQIYPGGTRMERFRDVCAVRKTPTSGRGELEQ